MYETDSDLIFLVWAKHRDPPRVLFFSGGRVIEFRLRMWVCLRLRVPFGESKANRKPPMSGFFLFLTGLGCGHECPD